MGSALASCLIKIVPQLICITRQPQRAMELSARSIPTLSLDITAPQSLELLPFRQPTLILHMASTRGGDEEAYRSLYYETIARLIRHFPESKILFVSSTSVYGQKDGSIVTESSLAEPSTGTGRILRDSEELVLSKGGVVARLSGLYGPGRWALVEKLLRGVATLDADGERVLNQIHRDDAVPALLLLIRKILEDPDSLPHPRIYNVTDDTPVTQKEFYTYLCSWLDRPLPLVAPPNPHRKRGLTSKRVSNQKMRALGWKPRFSSFREALPSVLPTLHAV
ncbi:MAG: NAD-dependent epimerase/dehydratase family protein [Methylacidiphilales bacterium]|nr:NAD-dependent epimerase/dehydratase family protein [Candidatus Methylacidiphilales bacterium]MDW8349301.1 NAD-dependent epimerase/dehydratase family protein [Verrucomicrobiae bacterium]